METTPNLSFNSTRWRHFETATREMECQTALERVEVSLDLYEALLDEDAATATNKAANATNNALAAEELERLRTEHRAREDAWSRERRTLVANLARLLATAHNQLRLRADTIAALKARIGAVSPTLQPASTLPLNIRFLRTKNMLEVDQSLSYSSLCRIIP